MSRDSFEYFDQSKHELVGYVARQSLVSAFGPQGTPGVQLEALESPFQRRMLDQDARSLLPHVLTEHAADIDLLMWDLFDERLGFYVQPGGGVITRSVELVGEQWRGRAEEQGRCVVFGSTEHRAAWRKALQEFLALLDRVDLLRRTVLVAPAWAARTTDGERTPTSFGLTPAHANQLTKAYLLMVQRYSRIAVIAPPRSACVASPGHQWGLAPFHYDPGVYRAIACDADRFVAGQLS